MNNVVATTVSVEQLDTVKYDYYCLLCKKPVVKEQLVTFSDGEWYDGDWHKGCLTTELAMMRASRALRQLGREVLAAWHRAWVESPWFRWVCIALVIVDAIAGIVLLMGTQTTR